MQNWKLKFLIFLIQGMLLLTAPLELSDTLMDAALLKKEEFAFGGSLTKDEVLPTEKTKLDESKRYVVEQVLDRMNITKGNNVTFEALKRWINHLSTISKRNSALRKWNHVIKSEFTQMGWSEYVLQTYGWTEASITQNFNEFQAVLIQERRRWNFADVDNNGKLNFDEYVSFLHPETQKHMRDAVIAEIIEGIDKDGDGALSEVEYLTEIASRYDVTDQPWRQQTDWIGLERYQFRQHLDWNKDGMLTGEEIGGWVMPKDFDEAGTEAQYLIQHVDRDGDRMLSREEILINPQIFYHSRATDFGRILDHELI